MNSEQTLYKNQETPVGPKPQPKAPPVKKVGIILASLAVIFLAIATGYFLFIKNIQSTFAPSQDEEILVEYKNENGFALGYPEEMEFSETAEGMSLVGDGELSFVVGKLNGEPLLAVVDSLAENFGIELSEPPETFTADARTGYKLSHNGVVYYYFPLFGDNYLEIADKGDTKKEELVSELKFVAPQSASVN